MKVVKLMLLVLALAMVAGRSVAMLPPDVFKEPIFASQDTSGSDGSGDEITEFA